MQVEQLIPRVGVATSAARQQFGFRTHARLTIGQPVSFEQHFQLLGISWRRLGIKRGDARLPNCGADSIFCAVMKNQLGIIILIVISVGLVVALVVNHKSATEEHQQDIKTIGNVSNQLVQTTTDLEDIRKVNTDLNKDVAERDSKLVAMTNQLTEVSGNLSKTEDSLKKTQEQMAKDLAERDARIVELTSQNQALDQKALDLNTAITNLTSQIDDTQKKLAASEGDKEFLRKELSRLMTEKAELERQFNDLKVLRAQVSKLKEELTISRRLEWIRQGLFARDAKKGAQLLMDNKTPAFSSTPNTSPEPKLQPGRYDLNVEVGADGTVKVIPPPTNAPATK